MEALSESQEVIDAKNARKAVKGTLSRVVNQIKVNLVIQPGAKYDFSKLDKFSIKADAEKLQTRLQNLQEKNDAYCKIGVATLLKAKVSEEIIEQFENEVDQYWINSRKDATELLNLYEFEYGKALEMYLKNIQEESKPVVKISDVSAVDVSKNKKKAETDIKRQLNRWSVMKTKWNCIIQQAEAETGKTLSIEAEKLIQTPILIDADKLLVSIQDQWDTLEAFVETLWEVFDAGDVSLEDAEKKIDFDLSKEAKRMFAAKSELDRLSVVIKQQEHKRTTELNMSKSGVKMVETEKEKAPLKMDRIQLPKFSGKAEDYASWKEKFLSLVPQGRDDAEISVLLEQSIPESKRHLLRGCGVDHVKMLDVLQKELAPTRDVINSINLQLAKLKRITPEEKESDKKFVYMVESLEKMERDLRAINRLSVLANCNTMQDIECKLPHLVKTD